MGRLIDLTGHQFGILTVRERAEQTDETRSSLWHCECRCGEFIIARSTDLTGGQKRRCGPGCKYSPPKTRFTFTTMGQAAETTRFGKTR